MIYFDLSIILLLTCCWQQIQVQALFDITSEALDLNHKLMKEVEITSAYKNEDELEDKLKIITDLWLKFMDKFGEEQTDLFLDDVAREAYNASFTLHFYLQDFQETVGQMVYRLNDLYGDKNYDKKDKLYYWRLQRSSTLSEFIYENDYNLYTEKSWKDNLNDIHKSLVEIDLETGQSIMSLITNNIQAEICKHQSCQQLVFNILRKIIVTDAGGYAAMSYAYAIYKIKLDGYAVMDSLKKYSIKYDTLLWKNKDIISKMLDADREFVNRNINTLQLFKTYIVSLPRNLWNHDSVKDDSYVKMERVFQKYIVNEVDLNEEGTCKKECSSYTETKIYGCYNRNICARQQKCDGTIRNCDNTITSAIDVCLSSKDQNSRYEYMDVDGERYGRSGSCRNDRVQVNSWPRGFYKCSYCMCICENPEHGSDRFFNLRPVTSNIDLNYVVTGARFQKENGVIHIQIQQGQLLQNGVVNSTTLEWKLVDNYTISDANVKAGKDYHIVTWAERTLFLDELDSPKNHVLTGLRFKLSEGSLKLEIRMTNFNFTNGKLVPENSRWYSNGATLKDRNELQLDDLKENVSPNLKSYQYLYFTTSALEIDAGQNTIPFIDITSVASRPAVPLSGAGTFLKSDNKIGTLLSLKLLTYDFKSYVTAQI